MFNGDATVGRNENFEAVGTICCDHGGNFLRALLIKFRDSRFDNSGSSSGHGIASPC